MGTEQTLAVIKPGAVKAGHAAAILSRALCAGLMVSHIRQLRLDHATAAEFYAEHIGRPYFGRIVADLISGPIVAAILEGPEAIATWRRLLGPSDPLIAPPGTIRRDFGTVLPANAAHGSDSADAVGRERAVIEHAAALVPTDPVESSRIIQALMTPAGAPTP